MERPAWEKVEALVGRLTAPDCLTKGWVLDGFPSTLAQAELLATYGFRPRVVMVLELSEAASLARSASIFEGLEVRALGLQYGTKLPVKLN